MRDGFIFYKSFRDAINKLDDETRLKCYDLIIEYGITGDCPEINDNVVYAIFLLIKPILDANYQRYLNGKKGGRPKKNTKQPEDKKTNPAEAAKDPPKEEPKKEKQPPKKAYGVYKNVLLSDHDYELLVANKGIEVTQEAILELDSYIEALSPAKKKDYLKRNHKVCIDRWVFSRIEEKQKQSEKVINLRYKPSNFVKIQQEERPEGYYDNLEKQLLDN